MKLTKLALIFAFILLLTGCYDLDALLVFDEHGHAEVYVNLDVEEDFGGDEARIVAWQMGFAFPEIGMNYEQKKEPYGEFYDARLGIHWVSLGKVDLNDSPTYSFTKNDDGTYEFLAEIDAILASVLREDRDMVLLTFSVALPGPVAKANSAEINDNVVTWQVTKEMLAQPSRLRAVTY